MQSPPGAVGPDEKLTLQAALGMKAFQQELAAHKNLIVTGSDELFILTALSSLLERSGRVGLADDIAIIAAGSAEAIVYRTTFMVGQGLEVVALFDSDDEGRVQEAKLRTKWLPHFKDTRSSTVLLGTALDQAGHVGIEDLQNYLRKAHEVHATALTRAGVDSITPEGSGTLVTRVARGYAKAGVKFSREAVAKVIRKGCGQLLMFWKSGNTILVDFLPELMPPAFGEDEGSQAKDDLSALWGPAHSRATQPLFDQSFACGLCDA
jgi:hypothetical protein